MWWKRKYKQEVKQSWQNTSVSLTSFVARHCLISSLPISPLVSLSCVSLSRPPSERCLLILECAARLPTLIGGLSDHLLHAAFPHSLSGRAAGLSCRWCFPARRSLCYIFLHYLFSSVLQLLTTDGCYWHLKLACIPAGISHEKTCDGVLPQPGL